jgi:hypothetical protein
MHGSMNIKFVRGSFVLSAVFLKRRMKLVVGQKLDNRQRQDSAANCEAVKWILVK